MIKKVVECSFSFLLYFSFQIK